MEERSKIIILESYQGERKPFALVSKKEVVAVNEMLGIEASELLTPQNMPARIYLGNLWEKASPILENHPPDRELAIGWDLVSGKLKITEVAEGLKPDEIPQGRLDKYLKVKGMVDHAPHLICFHSHVLGPGEALKNDEHALIIQTTPRSSYDDMEGFVLHPDTYAQVVVDLGKRGEHRVGRVLVGLKTTDSWMDIDEDNYKRRRIPLVQEMCRADLIGIHKHQVAEVPWFTGKKTRAMISRLQGDEHWCNFTGVMIYRGLILEGPKSNSVAYRWDVFYKRLMVVRKKKRNGFDNINDNKM